MKKIILSFILILLNSQSYSQDTLRILKKPKFGLFSADTFSFKKHIYFQIDNRNSFIKSKPVNIYGINVGYFISEKIQLGIGGYLINKNFFSKRSTAGVSSTFSNTLNLHYFTPNLTYVFLNTRWFELSLIPETGYGIVKYEIINQTTNKTLNIREYFIPIQLGLGTLFKVNRWLGLQGSIGYRYIAFQSKGAVFKTIFNGFYYNYGVQVVIGNILKDLIYVHKYHKQQKYLRIPKI